MTTTDWQEFLASNGLETVKGQKGKGGNGDFLEGIVLIPITASPGKLDIKDGSDTAITLFPGIAGNSLFLIETIPSFIFVGAYSTSGAWQVETGANMQAIAIGRFQ